MLSFTLDRLARRTYTRQIYDVIRGKILSGELPAGAALPPYRELSHELSVSKNTVLSAYDMLVADGVLRSVPGSGFYVEEGLNRSFVPVSAASGQPVAMSDRIIPDDVINFDNGQPALELFPRARWNKAVTRAMLDAPASALGYDLPQGRPELRSSLCPYLYQTQDISCQPDDLLITSGAKQAISLVAECLLRADQEVWIEDPAPALLRQLLSCHTSHIRSFPVDRHGLNPAVFPSKKAPALIIASPARQFPTGAMMPMTRKVSLLDYAEKTGAYILEDNFEHEFSYDTPPVSSLWELSHDRVISIGTFSKVMYPSIRLGYMVIPPALLSILCEHKRLSDHHSNTVCQLALSYFLADGSLDKHIRRMRREYRSRRDHLIQCLHQAFGERVQIGGMASGMNLTVDFSPVLFSEEQIQHLLSHGIYAVPVEYHSAPTAKPSSQLILRYCGLTKEELSLGVERLKKALDEISPDFS